MEISIIFLAAFAVHAVSGSPLPASSRGSTTTDSYDLMIHETESSNSSGTGWIEQKLDHFNDSDTRKWQMRYMYTSEFYQNTNRVIIYLSATYEIDYLLLKYGQMIPRVEDEGAHLFLLEGRFYGESLPTENLSIENLQYASTDQVLADVKRAIETIIEDFSLQNASITLTGLRVSGAMGAWFQLTYPGLVGNVDAYSPLLLAKAKYYEYYEFFGEILRNIGGDSCYDNIASAFDTYHALVIEENATELKRLLNICDNFNITNGYDVFSLFTQLVHSISALRAKQRMCNDINKANYQNTTPVSVVSKVIVSAFKKRNPICIDFTYAKKYDVMRHTSVETISRITLYRKCTEYGRFPTFDSLRQPFGNRSLTVTPNPCEYVFGEDFTLDRMADGVNRTNAKFGGNNLIENVNYLFGDHDISRYLSQIVVPEA